MMRYIYPGMTKDEIELCNTYPFVNKATLYVSIYYKKLERSYTFRIDKGYSWNGADIPRLVWSILGISQQDNRILIASLLHDFCCENRGFIGFNRKLSSLILKGLLIEAGVHKWKANIMYWFVDLWQRTQRW